MKKNNYPVVLFLYKRARTTAELLEAIKSAGIKKIYVFSDGPKNEQDLASTQLVREAVAKFVQLNPSLDIITHYAKKNLGLKRNIINGLNQVFAKEDGAIILEDDCHPHPDFFRYATGMLAKYNQDPRIMSINGTNVSEFSTPSYLFTRYSQCWGWATWSRAWKLYDPELKDFNKDSWRTISRTLNFSPLLSWYFYTMLKLIKAGQIDTWDFQWSYAHFIHHGLAIVPSANLISNTGFDSNATNTKMKSRVASLATHAMPDTLVHPEQVTESQTINQSIESNFYANPIAILGLLRQYFYYLWSRK